MKKKLLFGYHHIAKLAPDIYAWHARHFKETPQTKNSRKSQRNKSSACNNLQYRSRSPRTSIQQFKDATDPQKRSNTAVEAQQLRYCGIKDVKQDLTRTKSKEKDGSPSLMSRPLHHSLLLRPFRAIKTRRALYYLLLTLSARIFLFVQSCASSPFRAIKTGKRRIACPCALPDTSAAVLCVCWRWRGEAKRRRTMGTLVDCEVVAERWCVCRGRRWRWRGVKRLFLATAQVASCRAAPRTFVESVGVWDLLGSVNKATTWKDGNRSQKDEWQHISWLLVLWCVSPGRGSYQVPGIDTYNNLVISGF